METTTSLKTFEVTIPEKYADILKKFITSLEGKVKAQKKSGLDEALEDVKAGRIYHAESTKDLMKQILGWWNIPSTIPKSSRRTWGYAKKEDMIWTYSSKYPTCLKQPVPFPPNTTRISYPGNTRDCGNAISKETGCWYGAKTTRS